MKTKFEDSWREIRKGVFENKSDKGTVLGVYRKQIVTLDKPSWIKELKRRGKKL